MNFFTWYFFVLLVIMFFWMIADEVSIETQSVKWVWPCGIVVISYPLRVDARNILRVKKSAHIYSISKLTKKNKRNSALCPLSRKTKKSVSWDFASHRELNNPETSSWKVQKKLHREIRRTSCNVLQSKLWMNKLDFDLSNTPCSGQRMPQFAIFQSSRCSRSAAQ